LTTYVAIAKTNIQREIDATTIIIASYNNINQRRQLKKTTREKTVIFKIRKQREKNNLRTLFVRKLMKKLQRAEKMKKNVMIARRLFNENVKLMIRSEKIKNKLTINNSLLKHVTSSTYAVFRIFDVLTHDVRVVDVQTKNQ
jgi:mevalonate kinase